MISEYLDEYTDIDKIMWATEQLKVYLAWVHYVEFLSYGTRDFEKIHGS